MIKMRRCSPKDNHFGIEKFVERNTPRALGAETNEPRTVIDAFCPAVLHVEAYSSALDRLNGRARGVELSAGGTPAAPQARRSESVRRRTKMPVLRRCPETDFARCKFRQKKEKKGLTLSPWSKYPRA